MKSNILKAIIGSGIALVVALGAWAPLHAQAADQIKGATKLMQSSQTAPAAAPAVKAMNCATCKDVAVSNVNIEKGHIRIATVSAKHDCPGCSTTVTVTGQGKGRTEQSNHSCTAGGAAASCCGAKTN